MTGKTLGHYRILEKIGAGGMGEVYRAHDEQLDRDVALKILPPSSFSDPGARARLLREARAAAGLNHPHICTIHEVGEADGQAYIAMELVEGQPLSARLAGGALPREHVLRYGLQLAEALGHAHERGIVHRDLKSANVVITTEGRAKVLDFGLAKRLSEGELDDVTRSQASLTAAGALVGTLAYMAPEQLRGQPADARSDVWALGVVLHEMAAGARPFQGRTGFELSSAILNQRPGPLAGKPPFELRAVIERCLEKEPGRRYQRGGEVQAALEAIQTGAAAPWAAWRYRMARRRGLALAAALIAVIAVVGVMVGLNIGGLRDRLRGGATAPRINSIAVLPLENLSRDKEQDFFADGMTEELITNLAKIAALKVISRTSVMRYKGTQKPLPEIAKELNVDAVIEGSVLREGGQVRVTAQLIQASTDQHLWAESYQRNLRDILALQDEVARAIANEIKVKLTQQDRTRLARAGTVNPEAYEAYLRGRFCWNKRTEEGEKKGLEYFQQAIERDPGYALGYAGVADSYIVLGAHGHLPTQEAFPRARAAAQKALAMDDNLAEAHTSLGSVKTFYDWDWPGAEIEFKRAIELNPNYATAYHWYSHYLVAVGRLDDAVAAIKRARELDPFGVTINIWLAETLYYARQYDPAIDQYRKTIEIYPDWAPALYGSIGNVYEQKGIQAEAVNNWERSLKLSGDAQLTAQRRAYSNGGFKGYLQQALAEIKERAQRENVSPLEFASFYARLGDKNQAIAWLAKAIEERNPWLYLEAEPQYDGLRSDPRFQDLLRRMKFPE